MLLSVIIPIGNLSRDYQNLRGIINSISNSHIEIVFVLDTLEESADTKLKELCKSEGFNTYNILECTKRNPGASRNLGIKAAKFEWIVFCDSDDMPSFPNLLTAISKARSKCDIIIGSFQTENKLKQVTQVKLIENELDFNWNSISLNPGIWRWLIRRSLLRDTTFPELSIGEDQFFLIKLISIGRYIEFSSDFFYIYRTENQGSLTSDRKKIEDLAKNIELELFYLKSLKTRNNVINKMIFRQILTLIMKSSLKLKLKSLLISVKFISLLSLRENLSLLKFGFHILKSKK
jgi:CDP-glycerol glycerophosphotransferase